MKTLVPSPKALHISAIHIYTFYKQNIRLKLINFKFNQHCHAPFVDNLFTMAVSSTAIDSILTIPSLPTSDQVTTDDLQVMLSFTETSNLCEWINIPEEGTICGMRFETLDSFLTHIRSHISLLSKPGVCQWNLCRYSCTHPIEFTSHVLFHGHHSNLKCKGEEFSDFKCLPACQLGSELVNDVPKVEEGWKCMWEESDECCGKVFDCVNIYYDHVKEHVDKMEKSNCGWKGKCPYHVLQNYNKIYFSFL